MNLEHEILGDTDPDEVADRYIGHQELIFSCRDHIKCDEMKEKLKKAVIGYGYSVIKETDKILQVRGTTLRFVPANENTVTEKKGFIFLVGFEYMGVHSYTCGGVTNTVKEYLHKESGMEFTLVPGGSFIMGGKSIGTQFDFDEKPAHKVTLHQFLIAKTTVTEDVYCQYMINRYEKIKRHMRRLSSIAAKTSPTVEVSFNSSEYFCNKAGFVLPTESQWEYACRAGVDNDYFWGKNGREAGKYAWYNENVPHPYARNGGIIYDSVQPVKEKLPNAFGLYDMVGNVWEICKDLYMPSYKNAPRDGSPVTKADSEYQTFRVMRGGSYADNLDSLRSRRRSYVGNVYNAENTGFRVCYPINATVKGGKMLQAKEFKSIRDVVENYIGYESLVFLCADKKHVERLQHNLAVDVVEYGYTIRKEVGNKFWVRGTEFRFVESLIGLERGFLFIPFFSDASTLAVHGFEFLGEETYSCNGVKNTVLEYRHIETEMDFVLVPGGAGYVGNKVKRGEEELGYLRYHYVVLQPFLIAKKVVTEHVWALAEIRRLAGEREIDPTCQSVCQHACQVTCQASSEAPPPPKPVMVSTPQMERNRTEEAFYDESFRSVGCETHCETVDQIGTQTEKKIGGSNKPQHNISWANAVDFCRVSNLNMPSEVQWEFACRGGVWSKDRYFWGRKVDKDYLWYRENTNVSVNGHYEGGYLRDVAKKKPNAFGLYDMAGLIWEYCEDNYERGDYKPMFGDPFIDNSVHRVVRGGSQIATATDCAVAKRYWAIYDYQMSFCGVRPTYNLVKYKYSVTNPYLAPYLGYMLPIRYESVEEWAK